MSDSGFIPPSFPVGVFTERSEARALIRSRLVGASIPSTPISAPEEIPAGGIVVLCISDDDAFSHFEQLVGLFSEHRLIAVVPPALEAAACAFWEGERIADYVTEDRLTRLPAAIRKLLAKAEDFAKTVESQWESLSRVLTAIRETSNLESLFGVVTEDIGKLFGTDHAVVVRYLPEKSIWIHEAEARRSDSEPASVGFQIPDSDNPVAEKLKCKQIVTIEDTRGLEDRVNQEVSERFPGSWLLIPIVVQDEIWGSLSLLKKSGGAAWISRQMTFARIIAEHLGIAIQQAQFIDRLRQDIEERHHLYLALRESENRFSQVIGSSPIPFFLKNPDRRYLYVNPAFEKLTGLSLNDVIGANPADLPTAGLIRICSTDGESNFQPVTFEARLELESASHDLMVTQFPLLNENGETAALCGFLVEVTEQKNLIRTLRDREEKLRLLESAVEYARDSVLITDTALGDEPGQTIVYANRALQEQTGYSREEIIGQTPRMFQGPQTSSETRRRVREAILNWESITVEILNYRKDGTEYWAELSIVPIVGEDGIYTHWVAIQRDITERRQIEQETRNLKKMEAVGQLTSGVAHNFNNILMIISGHSQLLQRRLTEGSKEYHQTQLIQSAAARGAELVRQLMAYSRIGPTRSAVVNVNDLLKETVSMLEKVIPASIEMNLAVPPHAVFVELDPEKLVQSILNLAVNARDAMPDGGRLSVTLGMGNPDDVLETEGDRSPFAEGLKICILEVSDTGVGMDAATQERIFEPFFTTKEIGRGTGLGLYSVFGFVYESNGIIRVISAPGKGTRIRMVFPMSKKIPVPKMPENLAEGTSLLHGYSVLLVEDEPDTRELLEEILAGAGFNVTLAANGDEAVQIAQATPTGFDLLMTDWVMPKMSGRTLISVLSLIFPTMPIVVMTGNLDLSLPPDFNPSRFFFLTKPFTQKELFEVVATALATIPLPGGGISDLLSD